LLLVVDRVAEGDRRTRASRMHSMAASVTPPSIARLRFTEPESLVASSHQALAVTQKPLEEEPSPGFSLGLSCSAIFIP
jgi:hypothetical protein